MSFLIGTLIQHIVVTTDWLLSPDHLFFMGMVCTLHFEPQKFQLTNSILLLVTMASVLAFGLGTVATGYGSPLGYPCHRMGEPKLRSSSKARTQKSNQINPNLCIIPSPKTHRTAPLIPLPFNAVAKPHLLGPQCSIQYFYFFHQV